MKPHLLAALLVLALSHGAFAQTLCMPGETDHFSCPVGAGNKVLSICSNIEQGVITQDSWLEYRFGTRENIELIFPEEKKNSVSKFEGNFFNPREEPVETSDLRFMHGDTYYGVSASRAYGARKDGKAAYSGGVDVMRPAAKRVLISCRRFDGPHYAEGFAQLNSAIRANASESGRDDGMLSRFYRQSVRKKP